MQPEELQEYAERIAKMLNDDNAETFIRTLWNRVPELTNEQEKRLHQLGRKVRKLFVGAVNIRHYLNEGLRRTGGHIGDGIRPGERRKGYATAMLALALKECKKLGIDRVLVCCDKDNIGSAKAIVKNGGVLENEVEEDGHVVQRYWIDCKLYD